MVAGWLLVIPVSPNYYGLLATTTIFFIETMNGNDFTLTIPGYKFHHVSRKLKHKNACRASGGIGILISNKYANLTNIG